MADDHDPLKDSMEKLFKDNPDVEVITLGSLARLKQVVQEQLDLPDPKPFTWHEEPTDPAQRKDEPWDPGCGRYASDIWSDTYPMWLDYSSPAEFVRAEEGTYNRDTNHFLCDDCYIKAGQPTGPNGWRCP